MFNLFRVNKLKSISLLPCLAHFAAGGQKGTSMNRKCTGGHQGFQLRQLVSRGEGGVPGGQGDRFMSHQFLHCFKFTPPITSREAKVCRRVCQMTSSTPPVRMRWWISRPRRCAQRNPQGGYSAPRRVQPSCCCRLPNSDLPAIQMPSSAVQVDFPSASRIRFWRPRWGSCFSNFHETQTQRTYF